MDKDCSSGRCLLLTKYNLLQMLCNFISNEERENKKVDISTMLCEGDKSIVVGWKL